MSAEALEKLAADLPYSLALSVVLVALIFGLHKSRVPGLSFQAPDRDREPPLWGWPEVLVVLGVWYLVQTALGVTLAGEVQSGHLKLAVATLLVQCLSAAVIGLAVYRLVRTGLGQPLSSVGLRRTSWANTLPTLLLLALVLEPIGTLHALWTLFLTRVFGVDPAAQELVNLYRESVLGGDWLSVACLVAGGTVVAPVLEEVLFRGFIYGPIRLHWGGMAGACASSLLFAAFHWSLTAFVPLFVLGCLLCYVTERTGSLYPAMGLHLGFNSVTFSMQLLQTAV
jgi:membrane protease YdiL (CAAX protease family)